MISRFINALSIIVLLTMAAGTISAFIVNLWLAKPLALSQDYTITIHEGDTLSKIAYDLEQQSIITSARVLIIYARLSQKTKIEVGEYRLQPGQSLSGLLDLLQSGNVIRYKITLVEGKTFNDFLTRLQQSDKITSHLKQDDSYAAILEQLDINLSHPEGWFFPDTYQFFAGSTDINILRQAYLRMQKVLAQEWQNRADNLPYKTPYEALIMASIIEKETGVAYERAAIAGVFVRRLEKGMRLQTDPTIIYGLGKHYQGNIKRKHLRQKTPYNTYVIDGLPPTPIAMPGREAIHAALHPKAGDALYFVAKGDGSHYFSATLKEHNQAVQQYQIKKRSKNYQSSPTTSR